jgi:outer membrane receptor protein involved in Fe transport
MNPFNRLIVTIMITIAGVSLLSAQTGKISGVVKDAQTGDPLVAANIVVEGTALGAASDLDGYFAIIGVPPGTHTLRASMLGYAPQRVIDVRVSIDLNTTVNISLSEAVIQGEEVVVVAQRPVVKPDLAASTANISIGEVENLPVTTVSNIVSLQAGVQGLSIRGGGSDQTDFVLNGLSLRDERNNTPFTSISLLAVEEIQIQTGGFNAEYGNIRSGLANITTKEGSADSYYFGAFA